MAGILNIGTSALLSFQRSLTTTGHNIANSDTEGYSRQRVNLATQPPQLTGVGYLGSGVKVVEIQRMYDDFIATQLRSAQTTASEMENYFSHASRVDNILADPNIGLDPAIQDFFDAMQVMADDPASISSRQVLLSEGGAMVNRYHDLYRQFTDMNHQLNQEMSDLSTEITGLAQSIARVNQGIIEATGAAGGGTPNDLLDQREVLLSDLSKLINISVVPQDNGAWNVFIGKGQALVMGGTNATLTSVNSSSDLSQRDIAFTNVSGTQVVTDQLSGGELSGLINFREQVLKPAMNQLGLVAIGMTDRINAQHQQGLDLDGSFGGQFFASHSVSVLDNTNNASAAVVTATFVDTGNLTASDYELRATTTANQFTMTRLSDGQVTTINTGGTYPYTTAEIDGISVSISAAATAGDRYLIQPTRYAANNLTMSITDPRKIAAAGPIRAVHSTNSGGGPNQGTGDISQPDYSNTTNLPLAGPATITLQWGATAHLGGPGFTVTGGPGGTIAYDPATQSNGATFNFAAYGGMSFTMTGTPAAGDRFVIENNSGGVGDNRNALKLADLQSADTMLGQTGGGLETATFQEAYSQLVSDVGSKTHQAEVNFNATDGLRERHQNSLLSISGVNLDEEAANLIKYQQAYQAAAQVISVAGTLFDTLIGAVRR
ncbi:flagellar hook-associated protein FlgK [Sedimenticola selenatireducens]|uniref:Flagellar hook-associated protein 1 n=1 Tax=Sedimenticola selenatireducens TaxID=191960 RepID=A0A557SCZ1_9GAMM|nr:flagellar hook-associated protein FlgK [Sedimenticola selenatireducens]TVO75282.1 flagellar hook-associated protein FlgK [Sedimenticola selenatireducens]TVT66865.1 MAG: flagellar hook-associated protein FlgK [Sedimenticola selenatireducens]